MDSETADLVEAEVASMTDEEALDHYEGTDWHEDPDLARVLADDIAQRLRNRVGNE